MDEATKTLLRELEQKVTERFKGERLTLPVIQAAYRYAEQLLHERVVAGDLTAANLVRALKLQIT